MRKCWWLTQSQLCAGRTGNVNSLRSHSHLRNSPLGLALQMGKLRQGKADWPIRLGSGCPERRTRQSGPRVHELIPISQTRRSRHRKVNKTVTAVFKFSQTPSLLLARPARFNAAPRSFAVTPVSPFFSEARGCRAVSQLTCIVGKTNRSKYFYKEFDHVNLMIFLWSYYLTVEEFE